MRLAKELGIPNVNRMLRSMSGQDLAEWIAYSEQEPFGEERADLRMAILGSFLGNVFYQSLTGKEDAPFDVSDLMPKFGKPKETIGKDEAVAALDAMFSALVAATAPQDSTTISNQD